MNKSKQINPSFLFTAHKHPLNLLLKIAVHLSVQFFTCTQGAHSNSMQISELQNSYEGNRLSQSVLEAETVRV